MDIRFPAATPSTPRGSLPGVTWRVLQFVHAVGTRPDPAIDAELRHLLGSDDQWQLLARLTPFDRAHHLHVYRLLRARDCRDADVLRAALLHDVGKADAAGRSNAFHRALRVLLRRVAPGALGRLADHRNRRVLHGLYLACHHARLGAEMAREAGASPRCCELIACHEERAAHADPGLAALIAADEAAIR